MKSIQKTVRDVQKKIPKNNSKPKVVFLLGFQARALNASGNRTEANLMIENVNALNPFTFDGWQVINGEALINIDPDFIFILSADSHQTEAKSILHRFLNQKTFAPLKAVQNQHVKALNHSKFLHVGPRFGQALRAFAQEVYPEVQWD